ncbi:MAG: 16S rRNA (guanine(527)-N(7))-methyltransferase RsmG, partial [Pseudomonadota bacterium]|nr:16S rRNA (guanine(527)-N(7))-methyltransferase RsmG [Pseudomonadota bacterium]
MAGDQRQQLNDALVTMVRSLDLAVSRGQASALVDFVDLLARWNRTYNLTALRDPATMLTHHVVDCLAAVGPLRRELAGQQGHRLLDVGSGGGLPGIVFAIMEPAWAVTCVDSVGKKAAFLQHAGAALKLSNLQAVHARVESLPAANRYDAVTSRAFASLSDFTRLTGDVLAEAGLWMAMKGKIPADEIDALPPTVQVFHVEPLFVPSFQESRCLIWMRPVKEKIESERT